MQTMTKMRRKAMILKFTIIFILETRCICIVKNKITKVIFIHETRWNCIVILVWNVIESIFISKNDVFEHIFIFKRFENFIWKNKTKLIIQRNFIHDLKRIIIDWLVVIKLLCFIDASKNQFFRIFREWLKKLVSENMLTLFRIIRNFDEAFDVFNLKRFEIVAYATSKEKKVKKKEQKMNLYKRSLTSWSEFQRDFHTSSVNVVAITSVFIDLTSKRLSHAFNVDVRIRRASFFTSSSFAFFISFKKNRRRRSSYHALLHFDFKAIHVRCNFILDVRIRWSSSFTTFSFVSITTFVKSRRAHAALHVHLQIIAMTAFFQFSIVQYEL